jgi:3-oxoacyl-[acyl-carrier-protein] synthase III
MQQCSLLSLATAVPPHVVEQSEAKIRAREAFGGNKALFDRLSGVFDNAGIARRHIVVPQDWYMSGHGWGERNAVYLEATEKLFVEAAKAAIEKAGLKPEQIDGVVTVSTTGIATPSLEARVFSKVGFRSNVRRVPVFGLGCAGGVNGLSLAARLASADPGSLWLFVTVETCSISIRLDSDDPAAVVATALFGDGAAAAVVTSVKHSLARISGSAEKIWPDTFVSETNLATLAAEVRRAIGDGSRRARFLRTVYGFGYAFSGEALSLDEAPRVGRHPRMCVVESGREIPLVSGENIVGRDEDAGLQAPDREPSRRLGPCRRPPRLCLRLQKKPPPNRLRLKSPPRRPESGTRSSSRPPSTP